MPLNRPFFLHDLVVTGLNKEEAAVHLAWVKPPSAPKPAVKSAQWGKKEEVTVDAKVGRRIAFQMLSGNGGEQPKRIGRGLASPPPAAKALSPAITIPQVSSERWPAAAAATAAPKPLQWQRAPSQIKVLRQLRASHRATSAKVRDAHIERLTSELASLGALTSEMGIGCHLTASESSSEDSEGDSGRALDTSHHACPPPWAAGWWSGRPHAGGEVRSNIDDLRQRLEGVATEGELRAPAPKPRMAYSMKQAQRYAVHMGHTGAPVVCS